MRCGTLGACVSDKPSARVVGRLGPSGSWCRGVKPRRWSDTSRNARKSRPGGHRLSGLFFCRDRSPHKGARRHATVRCHPGDTAGRRLVAHRQYSTRAPWPARAARGRRDPRQARVHNAGGSVKDRAALAMVQDGERRGAARGRPGAARRDVGQHRHLLRHARRRARLPRQALRPGQRHARARQMLQSYGADLVLTDPMDGSDGAISEARRIYAERSGRATSTRISTATTPTGARTSTRPGAEILEQTGGRLTHFVAGLGTSGTFIGTGRRLRESGRGIELVSVQPDSPLHGLEGLKHMESAIVPRHLRSGAGRPQVAVATEDAHAMSRRLARDAGCSSAPSGGAALVGRLEVAAQHRARRDRHRLPGRRRALPVGSHADGLERARARIRAHLLRWRPRPHAQRRATTPRVRPSGAASQLDPSPRSSRVSPTGS